MRKSMVFCWALSLVLASGIFAGSQEPPKPPPVLPPAQKQDDDDTPAKKKPRPSDPKLDLSDAVKRAYSKVSNIEDMKIERFSAFKSIDSDGSDALLVVFEFENKDLAFYLGSKDPAKDQWFFVEHNYLPALDEAIHRNRY